MRFGKIKVRGWEIGNRKRKSFIVEKNLKFTLETI
jgi:hypothetical protein